LISFLAMQLSPAFIVPTDTHVQIIDALEVGNPLTTQLRPMDGIPANLVEAMEDHPHETLLAALSENFDTTFLQDVSDADVPNPEQRYHSILAKLEERVQMLAEIKGQLRMSDVDIDAYLAKEHPDLVRRLTDTTDAKQRSLQLSAKYNLVVSEPDKEKQCVVCQDVQARFDVCAECKGAILCEDCLSNIVLHCDQNNDECPLCRSKMRRPATKLN